MTVRMRFTYSGGAFHEFEITFAEDEAYPVSGHFIATLWEPIDGLDLGGCLSLVLPAAFDPQQAETTTTFMGDRDPDTGDSLLTETSLDSLEFTGVASWANVTVSLVDFQALTSAVDTIHTEWIFHYRDGSEGLLQVQMTETLAEAIMQAIRDGGYLDDLPRKARQKLTKYGDVAAFNYAVRKSSKFHEIVDIITMARRFQGLSDIDPLNLFLAYDIVSNEGFNVFGIDALNDVVATQAGYLFGKVYRNPASALDGSDAVVRGLIGGELSSALANARQQLLNHPVLEKSSTLPAFLSVQSAMRREQFVPVRIQLYGGEIDVWKETIGTCMQSNVNALRGLIAGAGSDQQFIDAVANHLSNIANRKTAFSVTLHDQEFNLSQLQVESLFQVIEVLMLIDQ